MRKQLLLMICAVIVLNLLIPSDNVVPIRAQESDPQDVYAEAILEGLNAKREAAKLPLFVIHPSLASVAAKASETLLKENRIPQTIWDDLQAAKYFYDSADAAGVSVSSNATLKETVERVVGSSRRMLQKAELNEIGIGIAQDDDWIAILLLAAEGINDAVSCDPETQENVQAVQSEQAETVLKLSNEARVKQGLQPLTLNPLLNDAALIYGKDMKANGYPKNPHRGTDGSEPHERVARTGYKYIAVRENILMRRDLSAEGAFDQWWNSPGHKANILGKEVTEMGLAFTCNPDLGEFYYTQVFAAPFEEISAEDYASSFITILNERRQVQGLGALKIDPKLMDVAAKTSITIAETRKYPKAMWEDIQKAGYTADGAKVSSVFLVGKPVEAVDYLLSKRDSAANLLNTEWTTIGAGMTLKDGTYYVVYIFAKGN